MIANQFICICIHLTDGRSAFAQSRHVVIAFQFQHILSPGAGIKKWPTSATGSWTLSGRGFFRLFCSGDTLTLFRILLGGGTEIWTSWIIGCPDTLEEFTSLLPILSPLFLLPTFQLVFLRKNLLRLLKELWMVEVDAGRSQLNLDVIGVFPGHMISVEDKARFQIDTAVICILQFIDAVGCGSMSRRTARRDTFFLMMVSRTTGTALILSGRWPRVISNKPWQGTIIGALEWPA